MSGELKVLFQKNVKIIYSLVCVTGKRQKILLDTPFNGFANIQFQSGDVAVQTIHSDDIEEVKITVYEGIPDDRDFPQDSFTVSGIIEVGNEGIMLGAGADKAASFPWPKGETEVLVLLKTAEVLTKQVKTITFYLMPLHRKSKNLIAYLFQR